MSIIICALPLLRCNASYVRVAARRPSGQPGWATTADPYQQCTRLLRCMTTGIATAVIITAASVAGIAQATLARLEADTRAQCAAAAWPTHRAAAHRDFCRVYGYPTP